MKTGLPDINSLSLAQQVAQMVVVRASGYLGDRQRRYPEWEPPAASLQHLVTDMGVGGVILLGGSAAEIALRCQQLQDWANIPLLIAADIEEGVGQRFAGATWFPPPMALSAVARKQPSAARDYARQMGAFTAREAISLGINWILAPVVDVNNNPSNPVINVRAFGENPEEVSILSSAFIQGTYPVLTTAKHFPGHGDTDVDSHLLLPILPHSEARLVEIELPPFQSAIASGVDAVMTAHLLIPAWDGEKPATLSHAILTGKLRDRLGFTGLIVTDALVMGAIANRYGANEAAVLAVSAGADIILMPQNPAEAINAVRAAVEEGRIDKAQITESVKRIWQAKQKVLTSTYKSNFTSELAQADAVSTAEYILRNAQQGRGCLSVSAGNCRNLIVVDDALNCKFLGNHTPAIALPHKLGYQLQVVDSYTPKTTLETEKHTLLQIFVRGNPWRGNAGLNQREIAWFQALVKAEKLQALVIYGSPYILEKIMPELPPEVPYVFTYGQMPDAQAIALSTLRNSKFMQNLKLGNL
ncbi:MAG: beta-glucosidase [Hormoscilla sp. SP5CHS1]|nr:beta-glucosidase [Hormoscilla sp. SP12CHS1]MBC6452079.1 beta-glucosidase [Hormoscilla sp. SP5CHS1]